jgi:ELWxxDGT repeat protein
MVSNLRIAYPWDAITGSNRELGFTDGNSGGGFLDIFPGTTNSVPNESVPAHFTQVGNKLIFEATDAAHGRELWVTDGISTRGTHLLKDINSGAGSAILLGPETLSTPSGAAIFKPVLFNGFVYFAGLDGNGQELWRTDGTGDGTVLFADINPGPGHSIPQNLTVSGNFLYFGADDGAHGTELWKTDGTTAHIVADINPTGGSSPFSLTDVDGRLFFTASDGSGGGLYVTDGITTSSRLATDFSGVHAAFNGKLYFTGLDATHGRELWVSDGTVAGTHIVADIDTAEPNANGNGDSSPFDLTVFNGALYFSASDGFHGTELWRSDGTTTTLLKDINPSVAASSSPDHLTVVGNRLFFDADDGTHGRALWVTDGSAGGTHLVTDINTGFFFGLPNDLQNVNGALYFASPITANVSGLFRTDGVTVTQIVNDYAPADVFDPFAFLSGIPGNDVNGDGISDVLWRNMGGEVDSWLMTGGRMGGGSAVSAASSVWQFAGSGDFTAGGTSDLLWRNTLTGEVDTWLMSGGQIVGGSAIGAVSNAWQPLGSGDFDGDGTGDGTGTADVLWRNTNTGEVDTWLMSGPQVNGGSGAQISGGSGIGFVSSAWRFAGIGDFDGDGINDVLWHNTTTGEVDTWLMNNGQVTGGRGIGFASSAWQSLGAGKFSGNGPSDILWRNTNTGEIDIWFVNDDQMTGGTVAGSVSSAWQFAAIGDVTGSGDSDIMWRNVNTGEVDTWLINNGHLAGGSAIGTASSTWQPQVIPTA